MNESVSILALMVKDHCKIDNLITKLEELKDDKEEFKKAFNKFEWELEKHIFAEEKAIFTSYKPEDVNEGYKMLPELTKQHNFILNNLSNIKKYYIINKKIEDFFQFKNLLLNHRKFEENEVYKQLDKELNNEQKNLIIKDIEKYL